MLKKEGKGNKPNAAEALNDQDISMLWETGAFVTLSANIDHLVLQHQIELLTLPKTRIRADQDGVFGFPIELTDPEL